MCLILSINITLNKNIAVHWIERGVKKSDSAFSVSFQDTVHHPHKYPSNLLLKPYLFILYAAT